MTLREIAESLVFLGNTIVIPLILTLALLVFVWGVFKYFFLEADNNESLKKGRTFTVLGILGLVLVFSLWGVVNILLSTLEAG